MLLSEAESICKQMIFIYFSKPNQMGRAFHFTEWPPTSCQLMQHFWTFLQENPVPLSSIDKFWNQYIMFLTTKSYFKLFFVWY